MRAIKFRGKRHDGIWMYGDLLHSCCNTYTIIQPEMIQRHIVLEETVGQFTGLVDMDGRKIFENDVIGVNGIPAGIVSWHYNGYYFIDDSLGEDLVSNSYRPLGEMIEYSKINKINFEVIGNIHDNPELLK